MVLPTGQPRAICFNSGGSLMSSATSTIVKRPPRLSRCCDEIAHDLDGERNSRDQDDVRTARDASGQRDPAAIAPHDLYHHHAVV